MALRARADELNSIRGGVHVEAWAVISTAARTILARHRLTAEQYRVLIEPFTASGLALPSDQ